MKLYHFTFYLKEILKEGFSLEKLNQGFTKEIKDLEEVFRPAGISGCEKLKFLIPIYNELKEKYNNIGIISFEIQDRVKVYMYNDLEKIMDKTPSIINIIRKYENKLKEWNGNINLDEFNKLCFLLRDILLGKKIKIIKNNRFYEYLILDLDIIRNIKKVEEV